MLSLSAKCIFYLTFETSMNLLILFVYMYLSFAYCGMEKMKPQLKLDLVGGSVERYLTTDQKHSEVTDIISMPTLSLPIYR